MTSGVPTHRETPTASDIIIGQDPRDIIQVAQEPELTEGIVLTHQNVLQELQELSPEQTVLILKTLQSHFEDPLNLKRHKDIPWGDVLAKLERNSQKLWSLLQMEKDRHEPDVIAFDEATGQYEFFSCSPEVPEQSCDFVYADAQDRAASMGVEIPDLDSYPAKLRQSGVQDCETWGWVGVQENRRRNGKVPISGYHGKKIKTFWIKPTSRFPILGFRATLKV